MPTSGVATADFDVATVIELAGRRAGWEVEQLTAGHATVARQLLVSILNEWSNMSLIPWAADQRTLTTTAGVDSYALSSDVIDLMTGGTVVNGGVISSLFQVSREEFDGLRHPGMMGSPVHAWLWRRAVPTLFLYPVPDKAYTVNYWVVRRLHDVTTSQQTLDAPMRWVSAVIDRLALELFDVAPAETRIKNMALRPSLVDRAARAENNVRMADVEQSSWFIFG